MDDWKALVPVGATEHRYDILQELAHGGLASLYLACRCGAAGCHELVALKEANPREAEVDAAGSLAHEAYVASRVHHPHVLEVIDVEDIEGKLVLVMEYVEGVALSDLAAHAALPPAIVARIVQDACEGLTALHDARDADRRPLQLTHQHLCPENLLVGTDGICRLANLGVAVAEHTPRLSRVGVRRGKLGYMLPEYARTGLASPRCDLYALAVTAWEALSGRPLFGAPSSLDEVVAREGKPVPAQPPHLREAARWDSTLRRALGCEQRPMFETAAELQRALGVTCASRAEVTAYVERVAGASLAIRRARIEAYRTARFERERGSGVRRIADAARRAG